MPTTFRRCPRRENEASTTHPSIFTFAEINADVTEAGDATHLANKRQKVFDESELAAA